MVFNKGFTYRWGQRVKDFGERLGHVRPFGIHIFGHISGPAIGLGNRIRDSALRRPAGGT